MRYCIAFGHCMQISNKIRSLFALCKKMEKISSSNLTYEIDITNGFVTVSINIYDARYYGRLVRGTMLSRLFMISTLLLVEITTVAIGVPVAETIKDVEIPLPQTGTGISGGYLHKFLFLFVLEDGLKDLMNMLTFVGVKRLFIHIAKFSLYQINLFNKNKLIKLE
ncbi:hypothetical protein Glove_606g195 [Diversispora epigaea]|uniref:Uncharacterized protein n=1 Tax=Diversispora epigaea TaxID=1348612 RepID=A0A397G9N3_9GLOM|nr:hypothetical protein Glove_606g195 [Diversispora epigaea]